MPEPIKVPDIEGPVTQLCWKQAANMTRCDRRQGHLGPHSWECQSRAEPEDDGAQACKFCGEWRLIEQIKGGWLCVVCAKTWK